MSLVAVAAAKAAPGVTFFALAAAGVLHTLPYAPLVQVFPGR